MIQILPTYQIGKLTKLTKLIIPTNKLV